jgi:hypothetical protein
MGCCAFSPKRFGCGSSGGSGGSGGASARVVRFTATGGETDEVVPIGFTMPSADYAIVPGMADVTDGVVPQFPVADRTTTQFRMLTPALAAGDVIDILLVPR